MELNPKSTVSVEDKITESMNNDGKKKKKTKKPRCALVGCRKKLQLTDWACKCNKKFCQKHRGASLHSCSYNWKACHQTALSNTMLRGKSIDTKNFVNI